MKRDGFCFFWVSSGFVQMSDRTLFNRKKVDGFHRVRVLKQGMLESKGHDPFRGEDNIVWQRLDIRLYGGKCEKAHVFLFPILHKAISRRRGKEAFIEGGYGYCACILVRPI